LEIAINQSSGKISRRHSRQKSSQNGNAKGGDFTFMVSDGDFLVFLVGLLLRTSILAFHDFASWGVTTSGSTSAKSSWI
jgi:hypothetical protein